MKNRASNIQTHLYRLFPDDLFMASPEGACRRRCSSFGGAKEESVNHRGKTRRISDFGIFVKCQNGMIRSEIDKNDNKTVIKESRMTAKSGYSIWKQKMQDLFGVNYANITQKKESKNLYYVK